MLARALYDNCADFADELTFHRGDTLAVIERELTGAPGWWLCSFDGRQGIVPANRLQLIAVQEEDVNNSKSGAKAGSVNTAKSRAYFYQPPTAGSLVSPASSSLSPSAAANAVPPAYSESDPSPGVTSDPENADNTYENFASLEGENVYEDPSSWGITAGAGQATPKMIKQTRHGARPAGSNQLSPNSGLLVTTTAHHRVTQPGELTYQANSTDSGVYSHPPSNRSNVGDYAEDIYDYPVAFQQMQANFENFALASGQAPVSNQDGVYDMVPGAQEAPMGDYDFVEVSPHGQGLSFTQQAPLGDYDPLPVRLEASAQDSTRYRTETHLNQQQTPIGQQQVPSESMETLPEFSQAECEKAFENRRNVIERLVRYEHACTRAASRWAKLFGSAGWRKSSFLQSNAYAIRASGDQLAHAMTTFAAFAGAALSRLDFPTFATLSTLRTAYEPLYIEATNFKKYLNSVGLVNWTLENATPHLAKTFGVMLHSQRTFLTNLAHFSNILKRADFSTITTTAGSTHDLAEQASPSPASPAPQHHKTYMVVKDVLAAPPPPQYQVTLEPDDDSNSKRQRGISTIHINIPASNSSSSSAVNTLDASEPAPPQPTQTSTLSRPHQHKSLRFAEDAELVSQLGADLEQRSGELSFVISTFVLSLRRTQPSAINKVPELPEGQRYSGGFIECGKLLVNVAHNVVIIGDKLATAVGEPDRSESIKTSADRLRVCIRVFVEKLKSLAAAGSRPTSAVDDLITHVEVLRSQAESIRHRLGPVTKPAAESQQQSLSSTPTGTLNR